MPSNDTSVECGVYLIRTKRWFKTRVRQISWRSILFYPSMALVVAVTVVSELYAGSSWRAVLAPVSL